MTRSVYVIGGAGTGKSAFTGQVLKHLAALGQLEDLFALPNKKNVVTLRGHRVGERGLYLGRMRDEHPGTDGLDRATSPCGALWLEIGVLPEFILAEGATLATERFLTALHEHTDLLLVHLYAEDWVTEIRLAQRGTNQKESFVRNTVTRSANLLVTLKKLGVATLNIDSAEPSGWAWGIGSSLDHLGQK